MSGPTAESVVVGELVGLVDWLGELPCAVDDRERIDRISLLERLRGAVAAALARESVEFAASQVAAQTAAGVPLTRRGRGVPKQLGYARKLSPATAAHELATAGAWISELPAVFGLLRAGRISEWVARLVAKQTRGLDPQTRRRIAVELADDLDLSQMGPREAEAAARRLAYEADPVAVLARARTARSERRVSVRPAPDTMAVLSAFLPAEQGIAAWACLDRYARTQRAAGDPRTLDQIKADTLVERVTGQATAAAVPVEVGLTMTTGDLLNTTEDLHHTHHPQPDADARPDPDVDRGPDWTGSSGYATGPGPGPGP